jgi:hypothetical protein
MQSLEGQFGSQHEHICMASLLHSGERMESANAKGGVEREEKHPQRVLDRNELPGCMMMALLLRK